MPEYVLGVDYGTDSVRTLLVDASNGNEISSSVFYYPRWKQQLYCDAKKNQFRQHPLDYLEGLEHTIKECIAKTGADMTSNIKAISVDTTGSTLIPVDAKGTPLSMQDGFAENPNAMFVLWKDHTAVQEADEINAHATKFETNYLQYVGGIYSSEWFWAKILHILRKDAAVSAAAYTWVEHCDWIPFVLTGSTDVSTIKRSVCAAGHKGLWAAEFGGFPPNDFFKSLDSKLDGLTEKLHGAAYASDICAGTISTAWAEKLGLPTDVKIGVGAFDCHMGAVGGEVQPYILSKVLGTTTCDMMVAPASDINDRCIKGICGQVNGSIIPGMIGLEAGQSAFGDTYAWFKNVLAWPIHNLLEKSTVIDATAAAQLKEEMLDKLIATLTEQAKKIPNDINAPMAMDWLNGRRTPDANQNLKGAITNLNLGSDAAAIFKALIEATCFGSKAIAERFKEEGVAINGIIALGGVAKKSPYIMQTMATVLNMPIQVHKSEQTCALGAAMFAATVAGIYSKVEDAMKAMGQGFETTYEPNTNEVAFYQQRYEQYKALGKFVETK